MSDPNEESQTRNVNVQTNHEQNNYASANTTDEVEGERNRDEQRHGDQNNQIRYPNFINLNDDNRDAAIQASPPQSSNLEIKEDTKTTVNNEENNRMPFELEDEDTDSGHTLTKEISQYIDTIEKSGSNSYYADYPGTESINYDYTGERQSQYTRTTNLLESTAHLIKGCLGAGILTMHEAYMYGGLWTSLAATCVIGIVVPYTMFILVRSAQTMYVRIRVPRLSYPDLAEAAVATGPWKCCRKYSKAFRYTVDVCLFIELCGTCCVYEIMIAQTVKQAMEAVSSTIHAWQLSIKMYILIVTVHLLLVCLIRSLKYLAPFSLIADCSIGICVLITLYYSLKSEQRNIHDRPAWKSLEGLYRFCGVCIFSVDGVGIALPIENNMTKPKYFNVVLQCGMTIVFVCITIVGFFGYWAWGETCRSPITVHMPVEHYVVPVVLQFLLSLMLSVSFALSFWVPFRIVWHYLAKRHKRKRGWWERLYRAIHVMVITGLAIAVPDVHEIMSFLGDFLLAFNGFIFPAFIESMVTWKDHRKGRIRWTLVKDLMIVLMGLFLGFGAIYMNLK